MTKKKLRYKPGDAVVYHGRRVEILEVGEVRTPHGELVDVVRVLDPARGRRGMFRWQLEEGLGKKPEKLVAERSDAFK